MGAEAAREISLEIERQTQSAQWTDQKALELPEKRRYRSTDGATLALSLSHDRFSAGLLDTMIKTNELDRLVTFLPEAS